MSIFKEKKPFEKSYVKRNTKRDWDMDQEHNFALWKDPSESVVFGLIGILGVTRDELDSMSDREIEDMNDRYYGYISEVIIDCDIANVSFETAEDAMAAFEHPEVDWTFFQTVVGKYIDDVLAEAGAIKKVLRYIRRISTSGENSSEQEEE